MKEQLYLLGHPIGHSKSPAMHNALYEALGINWNYGLKDIATEEEALQFLDQKNFFGINITTPYKPLAFEMSTVRAASAKLAHGSNLLVKKGESLIAYNMDGEGCVSYLEREGVDFTGKTVAICGTGPTALAIYHTCALAGAEQVILLSRTKDKSKKFVTNYLKEFNKLAHATIELPALHEKRKTFRQSYDDATFSFGSYRTSQTAISEADIIINATPLGMNEGDKPPFNADLLNDQQVVFDVVYGHGQTELMKQAREKGCAAFDGSGMLVAQAVEGALVFLEVGGINSSLSRDEMFTLMAKAAEFDLS